MSKFTVHTIENAPEGSKPVLNRLRSSVGAVPNLAGAMAGSPTLIDSYVSLREIIQRGSFSPVERELIMLTNATGNKCNYCQAIHSTFAGKVGVEQAEIDRVRCGELPSDSKLVALVTFARKVLKERGHVSEKDLSDFYQAGYTSAQALEYLACLALSTMANYTNHFADVQPDEFIKAQYRK